MNQAEKIRVLGLGGGGHAKVVIEILRADSRYEIVGLLDSNSELEGQAILGVPVLGSDDRLPELMRQGVDHFFLGLGGANGTLPRRRLYEYAIGEGAKPVGAIHPQAIISESARIGLGVTVMAGAVINACARLGVNVIINSAAIVEHDCIIGDHAHIATGARLAGAVQVEEGAHVGLGACVRQGLRVGRNSLVGAGAVVVKDVPDNVWVAGVPASILQRV